MTLRTVHDRVVGDTKEPLGAILERDGVAVDLSAAEAVEFKMVRDDGTVVRDWTAGAFVDKSAGKVQFDFEAADVATAGIHWGWFRVGLGGEWDTFPVKGQNFTARGFRIAINAAS